MAVTGIPSKRQIDRAGDELREWWNSPVGSPVAREAAQLLFPLRAQFQGPMKKVTVGLRGFVVGESQAGATIAVGQRLKRAPRSFTSCTDT
jgi:hypothetical protein